MTKKSGFTLIELLGIILVISVIAVMSFSAITNTMKNANDREKEVMQTAMKNAAEIYIETRRDVSFITCVTAQTLIDENLLDPDTVILKENKNYKVTATMSNDIITYKVLKGTCPVP